MPARLPSFGVPTRVIPAWVKPSRRPMIARRLGHILHEAESQPITRCGSVFNSACDAWTGLLGMRKRGANTCDVGESCCL